MASRSFSNCRTTPYRTRISHEDAPHVLHAATHLDLLLAGIHRRRLCIGAALVGLLLFLPSLEDIHQLHPIKRCWVHLQRHHNSLG